MSRRAPPAAVPAAAAEAGTVEGKENAGARGPAAPAGKAAAAAGGRRRSVAAAGRA